MKEELKGKLKNLVLGKSWDLNGPYGEILIDRLVDYSLAVNNLTKGKISPEYIINKISKINTIRFGDFVREIDNDIMYDDKDGLISINSEEYLLKRKTSQTITYSSNGKYKTAICLFSEKEILIKGNMIKLPGGNLSDSTEFTQTLYHEITKYLATTILKHQDLKGMSVKNINYTGATSIDKRLIFNGKTSNQEDYYQGVSTFEYSFSSHGIVYHDKLDNGFAEAIARRLMSYTGVPVKDLSKFAKEVEFANKIIDKSGIDVIISKYFICSKKLISEYETHMIGNVDVLHFAEDMINDETISPEKQMQFNNYIETGLMIRPLDPIKIKIFEEKYCESDTNKSI